jgi:site-specific DNA recombinase
MSPSFSTKRGVRYFFYVSAALLRGKKHDAGSLPRVSADALETAVMTVVRQHSGELNPLRPDRDLLDASVERIVVGKECLSLELKPSVENSSEDASSSIEAFDDRRRPITVPWSPEATRPLVEIDERASKAGRRPDPGLVQAIVRAHAWVRQLSNGAYTSIEELAAAHGMNVKVVRKAIRLGFLAPDIVEAILAGDLQPTVYLSASQSELPLSWAAQRRAVQATTRT